MAPVFDKFLNRFRALVDSITGMRRTLVRTVRPKLGDFGSLTVCPSCHRITSKYKALCLECGRSLKTGLPEWDDSGKPIVDT
jgi:PHP family Zn ribbon phosphoesterase